MDIVLWILQGLLALLFLGAGAMKVTQSKDKIKESGNGRMDWVDDFSPIQVRVIGILEVLGGIGLILPMLTGILPILTPIAAVGLVLTMVGAMVTHIRRNDPQQAIIMNGVILVMALAVAIGRFVIVPVA